MRGNPVTRACYPCACLPHTCTVCSHAPQAVEWDKCDCWFAHCVKLNESERALFSQRGIGVAHCPSSNTRLASGIAPVRWVVAQRGRAAALLRRCCGVAAVAPIVAVAALPFAPCGTLCMFSHMCTSAQILATPADFTALPTIFAAPPPPRPLTSFTNHECNPHPALRAMLDQGVNVGLGVDGACSSDAASILAEARLALLLQRAGGDPRGLGVR